MEEYLIEEQEYKGCNIKIYQDDNPQNPREWDNLGTMVCFHNRYDLGDKTDLAFDVSEIDSWEKLEQYLIKEKQAEIIAPLYMYEHSGIRIKIGDFYNCGLPQGHARFDSGQVGFIYVDKETLMKEYSVKRITKKVKDFAMKVLETEVDTYDKYVSGQVYGFRAEDKEGNDIDSCWGYFDTDEAIKEAEGEIDFYVEEERKKIQKKVKALIKNKVDLEKREVIVRR